MPASNYKGISWNVQMNAWIAQYKTKGKSYYAGAFKSEMQAAIMHNVHIALNDNLSFDVKLKFYNTIGEPKLKDIEQYIKYKLDKSLAKQKREERQSTVYKDTSWATNMQNWNKYIINNLEGNSFSQFKTSEEAAEAYSKATEQPTNKRFKEDVNQPESLPVIKDNQHVFKFSTPPPEIFEALNLAEQETISEQDNLIDYKALEENSLSELDNQLNNLKEDDDSFLKDIEFILHKPTPSI